MEKPGRTNIGTGTLGVVEDTHEYRWCGDKARGAMAGDGEARGVRGFADKACQGRRQTFKNPRLMWRGLDVSSNLPLYLSPSPSQGPNPCPGLPCPPSPDGRLLI